jgi:uncharacterized protein Smg (DUF494 family)
MREWTKKETEKADAKTVTFVTFLEQFTISCCLYAEEVFDIFGIVTRKNIKNEEY